MKRSLLRSPSISYPEDAVVLKRAAVVLPAFWLACLRASIGLQLSSPSRDGRNIISRFREVGDTECEAVSPQDSKNPKPQNLVLGEIR